MKKAPPSAPSPRFGHQMAWDESVGAIVLVGGAEAGASMAPLDRWAWNGTTWTRLVMAPGPSPRAGHVLLPTGRPGELLVALGSAFRREGSVMVGTGDGWVLGGSPPSSEGQTKGVTP